MSCSTPSVGTPSPPACAPPATPDAWCRWRTWPWFPVSSTPRDFYPKNVHIFGFQITSLLEHGYDPRPDLSELLAGLEAGRFTVPIDATFPLSGAAEAHRHLESRANLGKVMLTVCAAPATPSATTAEALDPGASS